MRGSLRRSALLLALVLVISSTAVYTYWRQNFRFLGSPDAMRYATVAREFAAGNGFAWRQYLPYELATHGYDPDKTSPQFLHPLIIAGLFGAFGESDGTVMLASMIPTVLAAGLLFLLARRWFDDRVAFVAALVFALGEQTLYYSMSGLTEPLFIVLLLASVLLLTVAESSRSRLLLVFSAGAVLGLSHAARPVGLYYLAAFVIYLLLRPRQRVIGVGAFMFGFAIFLALSAYIGTGSLLPVGDPTYGLLTGVGEYPNTYDFHRSVSPPDPWSYVLGHLDYYQAKVAASLQHYATDLLPIIAGGSFYIGALFLMSLFARQRRPEVAGLRVLLLLLIGAQLAVNVLLWPTDRYFVPLAPLVIAFAIDYLWRLADTLVGLVGRRDPAEGRP